MSNEVSISQEQADMIEAGAKSALDTLLATGNFQPTLYIHDGEQMTFFTLVVQDQAQLHVTARQVISERAPGAVAYALLYDSSVETDNGTADVLIIETGDSEDDEAHEFARMYSREKGSVARQDDSTRFGTALLEMNDGSTSRWRRTAAPLLRSTPGGDS